MAVELRSGKVDRKIGDWVVRITPEGVYVKRAGKGSRFAGPVTPGAIDSVHWKQEAARAEADRLGDGKLRKRVKRGVLGV